MRAVPFEIKSWGISNAPRLYSILVGCRQEMISAETEPCCHHAPSSVLWQYAEPPALWGPFECFWPASLTFATKSSSSASQALRTAILMQTSTSLTPETSKTMPLIMAWITYLMVFHAQSERWCEQHWETKQERARTADAVGKQLRADKMEELLRRSWWRCRSSSTISIYEKPRNLDCRAKNHVIYDQTLILDIISHELDWSI